MDHSSYKCYDRYLKNSFTMIDRLNDQLLKQLCRDFPLDCICGSFTISLYYSLIDIILSYWLILPILCITLVSFLTQNSAEITSSKIMGNKSKKSVVVVVPTAKMQPTSDPGPSKKGLISDTTCLGLGNTS